ncbi:MAG: hypothetical protein GY790_12715 [Bacteroidetes bacterium]|nr:hypothetical protein [Bacteroidota bacterium]
MKLIHLFSFIAFVALLQGCYEEPIANFEYSYVDNMEPADISFTNMSTEADKYAWDFGDGSNSSEKNPDHAFDPWIGRSVTLAAKGKGGENSITKTLDITSYYIKNSFEYTLIEASSFFWDGVDIVDDFVLGDIYYGYDSESVITTHMVIHVSFEVGGIVYLTDPGFELIENRSSYINITGETNVVEVSAKKKGSMSQSDLRMILENGEKIKLKDLMAQ